jgi:hypothetical protein
VKYKFKIYSKEVTAMRNILISETMTQGQHEELIQTKTYNKPNILRSSWVNFNDFRMLEENNNPYNFGDDKGSKL